MGLEELGNPSVMLRAGDARLRMWIDGRMPGATARRIFELDDVGAPAP